MLASNAAELGTVQVAMACQNELNGGGALLSLALRGQATGTSALTISRCDINEGAIECTPVAGQVTVRADTASAEPILP